MGAINRDVVSGGEQVQNLGTCPSSPIKLPIFTPEAVNLALVLGTLSEVDDRKREISGLFVPTGIFFLPFFELVLDS
jgi:hypothetical protein